MPLGGQYMTCANFHIWSTEDALTLIYTVHLRLLPKNSHEKVKLEIWECCDSQIHLNGATPGCMVPCNLQLRHPLVKQGYSVYMIMNNGKHCKWHIMAYYVVETVRQLRTVDDVSDLSVLEVPYSLFKISREGISACSGT
ncbi:hypothetical protein BDN71DRAFT_1430267 [Pleurotus eryngii]|uniref:Uncharacterized protein n=1 Tax=Pleurotus eryngii TaxID=5323 RepID=A0A9P5ZXY7_PLEER|nr:hypothetical protein BDN71DRAFT_1430267 [Pleurotus eryngii]